MTVADERAALVALLLQGRRSPQAYLQLVLDAGGAMSALERDANGAAQVSLFGSDVAALVERARERVERWEAEGLRLATVFDADYPANLRTIEDRPPLVFVAGRLCAEDENAIAIIGSRRASDAGRDLAAEFARHLVSAGWTVISGLAAGIDAAAHEAALGCGGRTVAVIGTGLDRAYPPENADLQRRIAQRCAVVSQFWPGSPPTQRSFPARNAVMSGLSRGTVIVEASERSGARIQARLALAHGRPVFLVSQLLTQQWAGDLARRPGVHVVESPSHVLELVRQPAHPGAATK